MKRELSQIPALDGVRGIAALMVMIFHGWQAGAFNGLGALSRLSRACMFGQTGVDLFFVLSGFLITRILIATKGNRHYFKMFYTRRVLRIFPLYYLFLMIFYFGLPLLQKQPIPPLRQTWWYWAYLQNVSDTFPSITTQGPGHFWSLAVEEHFYLLWPLLVYLTPVRRLPLLSIALIVGAAVFRAVFVYGFGLGVFTFTLCRMDALAFGTLLASIEASRPMATLEWVFVVILGTVLPVLFALWLRFAGYSLSWVQVVIFTFIAMIYWSAIGLVIAFQKSRWASIALANRPLRFAGKISYGLYVFHPMCFLMIFGFTQIQVPGLLRLGFGIASTFVLSWFSFRFFESYFLRLKRFFAYDS